MVINMDRARSRPTGSLHSCGLPLKRCNENNNKNSYHGADRCISRRREAFTQGHAIVLRDFVFVQVRLTDLHIKRHAVLGFVDCHHGQGGRRRRLVGRPVVNLKISRQGQ